MLFLLFIRFVPMVAMAEVKAIMPAADPHHDGGGAQDGHERDSGRVPLVERA
jgi:molybdopterin-containing oxidoreductase family membrane subunit